MQLSVSTAPASGGNVVNQMVGTLIRSHVHHMQTHWSELLCVAFAVYIYYH
jgi:hypothetical protein